MDKNRILIVDNDPDIREVLYVLLEREGFDPVMAENGAEALEKIGEDKGIELIILDVMMPGMSGVETCEKLRELTSAPVLFLTAKSQEQDKVDAYTSGGDDYLVKPFSKIELLMKVKSLLRRYTSYASAKTKKEEIDLGKNVYVNLKKQQVKKDNMLISLTDKEYEILAYLLSHRGEAVEAKALYEGVWKEKYLPSAGNTIMVHILNLRKKLEENPNKPDIVKTVWGKGYRVE